MARFSIFCTDRAGREQCLGWKLMADEEPRVEPPAAGGLGAVCLGIAVSSGARRWFEILESFNRWRKHKASAAKGAERTPLPAGGSHRLKNPNIQGVLRRCLSSSSSSAARSAREVIFWDLFLAGVIL